MTQEEKFKEFVVMMSEAMNVDDLAKDGYETIEDILDSVTWSYFSTELVDRAMAQMMLGEIGATAFSLIEMGMVLGQVFPVKKYLSEEVYSWVIEREATYNDNNGK